MRYKIKIPDNFIFLLGVCSSMQLLSIGGITVFNLLLVLSVIACLLKIKKYGRDSWAILFMLSVILTTIMSQFFSLLSEENKTTAVVGGGVLFLILLLYYVIQNNTKLAYQYIKGFDITCNISLIWCCLQVIFDRLLKIDINGVIFGGLLGVHGQVSSRVDGHIIPTGFFYHRGVIVPILIYAYFRANKVWLKALTIIIAFVSKSASVSIGIIACVLFELLYKFILFIKKKRVSKKAFGVSVLVCFSVVLLFILFSRQIVNELMLLVVRILDASKNIADNSSSVHWLYYANFKYILSNMSVGEVLFGTGLGTSGFQYSIFNGQYANLESWVVESDFINIFINQGLVGFLLWLYGLVRIVRICLKKHKYYEHAAFVIIILGVGVLYNIQFSWVFLFELTLYVMLKNEAPIFNWDSNAITNILSKKGLN